MEEQIDLSTKILSFCKENLLIILIFSTGSLLLMIGLIQIITPNSSSDISYIPGSGSSQSDASTEKKTVSQTMLVDIAGAVIKPGVYEVSTDSRLKDIILRAGGFAEKADKIYISKGINLAQKITDGEKIYIPFVGEDVSAVLGSSTGKISINKASQSELESLSGVGPATAEKIIKARPYSSIEDLVNKKAVSKSVFERIKDEIVL